MKRKRGWIYRLLYGRGGRNVSLPMWKFYLLAPIYELHWFIWHRDDLSRAPGLRERIVSTWFNYRFMRDMALSMQQWRKDVP